MWDSFDWYGSRSNGIDYSSKTVAGLWVLTNDKTSMVEDDDSIRVNDTPVTQILSNKMERYRYVIY